MQSNRRLISQHYSIAEDCLLGKGSTGNVYLGYQLHPPHNQVAVKAVDLKHIDNEVTKYLLGCQITALTELSKIELPGHHHIVKLLEVIPHGQYIYIVTELLEGGTLADRIKQHKGGFSQEKSLKLLRQILEGYLHIQNKNIIHRDLKPDNVLFRGKNDPNSLAIIDFGYCEMEEVVNKPQVYYNVGSPKYMSPEAFRNNKYSNKSDIWALGVILYEMLLGKTCDEGHTMESYLQMIATKGIPLPSHLSPFIKQLLAGMLCEVPQNRYSCLQALRQIKHYQLKKFKEQQSHIIDSPLPLQVKNENPVFKSTMITPISAPPKTAEVLKSQFLPSERKNCNPTPDIREDSNSHHKLMKSQSANVLPMMSFKGLKPEIGTALRRVDNMNYIQISQQKKEQPYNRRIQNLSPKPFEMRCSSPCKINFKFLNQPNSQPTPLGNRVSVPSNFRSENQRQVRMTTQPHQPDENIRIYLKQKNEGLVGGFTLEEKERNRVSHLPMAHQFVCRQEVRGMFPHRQISLPKTIPH